MKYAKFPKQMFAKNVEIPLSVQIIINVAMATELKITFEEYF